MIPGLGNHLWQSTLFAIAAGFLTLLLRKNRARVRYRIWLAASVKFLLPFSLLIGLGHHLAWQNGSAGARSGLYFAMEEVSQPLTQATLSRTVTTTGFQSLIHLLPVLLAAVWFSGFLVVLSVWYASWRRISAARREAASLREGREVEALSRLKGVGTEGKRIKISLSRTFLEPGVFGVVRPVLLSPEGISERLDDAHLEAILEHEVCHVRRRDNLAAALHMVVEAIFWFHPLAWWLGTRLLEERELACDEEVLELGGDRQVYAESILKVCEFCVGLPLACVSGVTGADLKKRIFHIMSEQVAHKLDFTRKLLLAASGLLAVALPIGFGLSHATPSMAQPQAQANIATLTAQYEVTSIKAMTGSSNVFAIRILDSPDGFSATGVTVQRLIQEAHGIEDSQILGAPAWVRSQKYDIQTKLDKSVSDALVKLPEDQRSLVHKRMLQALLADRFKLVLHRETRDLSKYVLVVGESGAKVTPTTLAVPPAPDDAGFGGKGFPMIKGVGIGITRGKITGRSASIGMLADILSRQPEISRTVLDETGLKGFYDFTLQWKPDATLDTTDNSPPAEASGPTIFAAVEEQLGLKMEGQTGPVETLVVDRAEQPSEN